MLGISRSADGEALEWALPWPRTSAVQTTRRALVAWVSTEGDPRPVQAVAGWLP